MEDFDGSLREQDEELARCVIRQPKPDPIYQPEHYTRRSPQPIDVIKAWNLDFWLGNVMKYVGRCGFKSGNTELQDLKKAKFYLDEKIAILEGEMGEKEVQGS
jgi:hypothetical protein